LRDQQLLRKRVPFGAALPGKFDGVAQFQKLADLIGIQCLGGLHVYVHSVAARPSFHLHFQYHLALESSRVSVSSCVGQFFWQRRPSERGKLESAHQTKRTERSSLISARTTLPFRWLFA
jgi:hypothetical protein